jgi:hypothetical protein
MTIDCDRCTARGVTCAGCAVTFVAQTTCADGAPSGGAGPVELDDADLRALNALAGAGLIPPLRYAPRCSPRLAKAS